MKPVTSLFLLCWAILLGASQIHAQTDGNWTTLSSMPAAAGFMGGVAYQGKIYLFGGSPTITSSTSKAWKFDPADGGWTPLPDIPAPTCGAGVVELNGKIYIIGGGDAPFGNYYKTVRIFDPASGTWGAGTDMPEERSLLACSVLQGKIYVMGGGDKYNTVLKSTWVYDPDSKTWSSADDMPEARAFVSAVVLNDKIYVLGGLNGAAGLGLASVAVYDPVNKWTEGSSLPTARWGLGACTLGWRVFAMGGSSWDAPESEFSVVEMFDPYLETWEPVAPMPSSRRMLATIPLNNKIYTFGGIKGGPSMGFASAAVEVYEPDPVMLKTATPAQDIKCQLVNTPNPFSETTELRFSLPRKAWTELVICDNRGALVQTLVQQELAAGAYAFPVSLKGAPAGEYYALLKVDHTVQSTVKMAKVK